MKKVFIFLFLALLLIFSSGTVQAEILGIPDHAPASTLIVPMFETGIDSVANPIDTLLVVTNTILNTITVHYEVWDVYGNATGSIYGNFTLGPGDTQPFSMRGLIDPAPASTKTQLTDGAFYRGFVTFDVVTASTTDYPIDATYPFSSANQLVGWIYYARLTQGSANGLPMVHIESVPPGMDGIFYGFYQWNDDREEIDADARYSAYRVSHGLSPDIIDYLYRTRCRVYLDPVNYGGSRIIVFSFPDGASGLGSNFPGVVPYKRYDEAGNLVQDTTVNLNRVVNIIDVSGTQNGHVSIWTIPWGYELFAFVINYANHPTQPSWNWDAIFECYMHN